MNIYTKTGDKGTTSLFDNKRVSKDDIRVEAYGTIDELVSSLGLAKNYIENKEIYDLIEQVQNKLFTVASILATEDKNKIKHHIVEEDIEFLEKNIDKYMGLLNNPTGFIIPGSGKASGHLHLCRTICRRAERRIITLQGHTEVDPKVVKYVNRLSDFIYALGRYLEEDEIKVNYQD
ncbi:MAG: cob(I)yrinic acid a,c-diamide adenosyltransferase [Tissierellia bacterium]|nr:cob(I)yrinic acid a,c-diamide adenosyltransferase [Tissierellia bacterium]